MGRKVLAQKWSFIIGLACRFICDACTSSHPGSAVWVICVPFAIGMRALKSFLFAPEVVLKWRPKTARRYCPARV